ncbi:MAG TPA: HAD-IC family P-type ATPase, partial [Candidatus Dormibacteraeota bacterium]
NVPVRSTARALPTFNGLTEAEAAGRTARGLANTVKDVSSRSLGDILKANLLTRFNALLGSMLVVILVVGPLQDAIFGLILLANALIGIGQELRAKITLDRLAVLAARQATVVRDGNERKIGVAAVVEGDLVLMESGDEAVVDGILESDEPVELNEALITGESMPVTKNRGAEVLAGSFVSAGRGRYRATRVGEASYARRLTAQARTFQLVRSELMTGINRILRIVTWLVVPTAALLFISQLRASPSLPDAIRGSVAGVITLVPEGLVLLTSASLALAVVRLGRKKVLIQQLPAVEMLARTDVVCMDKTGTLTETESSVETVEALSQSLEWQQALGAVAHSDPNPNPSIRAIASGHPAPQRWMLESTVPFSSSRKWSAFRFTDRGWWVLGAPDVMLAGTGGFERLADRVDKMSAEGRRVIMLARASFDAATQVMSDLEPAALVVLNEAIKPGAAETLKLLVAQGVSVKLLSGDHPATVAAIAARVGLITSGEEIDGKAMQESGPELLALVERTSVFGRISPEQKRDVVSALRAAGHTVAMVGDGVNDVLAMKEADIGIAMGGGSAAARAVAACVLIDGSFAGVPAVLAEGRRVIGNVERLASLFFTKTTYAFLLALAVSLATLPFPFLPRQLTLISAFTIGIPSVYLALAPSFEPSHSGFVRRVMRFALPAGAVAAVATFAAYALAVNEPNVSISEERTVATVVIAAIGLWILARLAQPLTVARRGLIAAMAAGLAIVMLPAPVRLFFDLDFPRPIVAMSAVGIIALAFLSLDLGDRGIAFLGRYCSRRNWGQRPL